MRFIVQLQDGTNHVKERGRSEWHYCQGTPFGFKTFADEPTVYWINGVMGGGAPQGGVYFARAIIELDVPLNEKPLIDANPHVSVELMNGKWCIVYGSGADYIEPQAIRVIRWNTPNDKEMARTSHRFLACPESLASLKPKYDGIANTLAASIATGVPNPGYGLYTACGPVMPYGILNGYQYGGEGIDPRPGWHRSYRYARIVHDQTMHRMARACVRHDTGEPIMDQVSGYEPTRGKNKVQHRPEFVQSIEPANQYQGQRIAKDWNTGVCAYKAGLVGAIVTKYDESNRPYKVCDGGYDAIDPDHLVRATSQAKALAFGWNEQSAHYSLRLIAADAWSSWKAQKDARHEGHIDLGRGAAWTLDALCAANFTRQRDFMVKNINGAQMPSGFWYRVAYRDDVVYPPDPWHHMGMPKDRDAANAGQSAFMALAMVQAGAETAARGVMESLALCAPYPFLWVDVGPKGGPSAEKITNHTLTYQGKHASEVHQTLAAFGTYARAVPEFRRVFSRLIVPNAIGPLGDDPIPELLAANYPEGSAAMLCEAERR